MLTQDGAASPPGAFSVRLGLIHSFVAALEGIAAWMKDQAPEVDIVLQASTWSQAARKADSRPSVLLVDLQNLRGPLLVARIAAARSRNAEVVVWADSRDDAIAQELIDAGAASVLGKHNTLDDARAAVLMAADPQRIASLASPEPVQSGGLVDVFHRSSPNNASSGARNEAMTLVAATNSEAISNARLTEADIEAVRLYANGHSPVDIALRMNVRFDRVRDHLSRVREHYEAQGRRASNRLDLVQRASEDGFLDA